MSRYKNKHGKMKLTENNIYIVGRSTKYKQNIIAKDFNIKDSLLTHIGLGLLEDEVLKIYNVSNYLLNDFGSSLIVEDLESFIDVNSLTYYSIWEKESTAKDIVRLKKTLNSYIDTIITFDDDFMLKNKGLYCSEFVYLVLKQIDELNIELTPKIKKLTPFYSRALRRDYLEYIPVDFFQEYDDFKLLYSKNLKLDISSFS